MADKKTTTAKRRLEYDIEGHGTFVFCQPPRDVYQRLMSQYNDDNIDDVAALAAFNKSCLVEPGPDKYEALIDDYPGFLNQVGLELQDLARPEAKAVVKKG